MERSDLAEKERSRSAGRLKALIAVWFLIIIAVIGIAAWLFLRSKGDTTRILKNVTAAGVDIGGMSREEADAALKNAADAYQTTDMIVQISGTRVTLTPDQTGAKLNTEAVLDEAMQYGHTGTRAEQAKAYAESRAGVYRIGILPYLQLDTDAIYTVLDARSGNSGDLFRQSSYSLVNEGTPGTLVLDTGASGFGLDINALLSQILDAYNDGIFAVEAETAMTERQPEPLNLDAIYDTVCVKGEFEFDLQDAKARLAAAQPGEIIRIPLDASAPVRSHGTDEFSEILSSIQTEHSDNAYRNVNLQLICQTLNGMILQPGQIFSFNEVMGDRTKERGFLPAPAYNNTSDVSPIGGGVDQAASALYNCAIMADLAILERCNDDFLPGYVDPGTDAAVLWYGKDLKIQNNTDRPIKIYAEYREDVLDFRLLGSLQRDYYVKIEYHMSSVPMTTIYQDVAEGSGIADGTVIQSGNEGFYVQTFRCRYSKDGDVKLSEEPEASSSYPMNPAIIAKVVWNPTEPTPPETEPTIPPTEPETEPTEPSPGPTPPETEPSPVPEEPV